MGKLAIKYGSFINLLLMEAWFLYSWYIDGVFNWEPAILFITSISAFMYLEFLDQRKIDLSDKKLFHDFLDEMPYEGSITFIDRNDMSAGPFEHENHEDLRNFYYHWDNASHEFIHKGIEKRRRALWEMIESYVVALDTYTVPTDDGKQIVSSEFKEKDPDKWKEIVNEFHTLAGLIVITHQDFVRYAKKKLQII